MVKRYRSCLEDLRCRGPVIDIACGDGHNGIYLAARGFSVILADRSAEALAKAGETARKRGVDVTLWKIDLEQGASNPFDNSTFGAVLVFRYLHRPLIPCMRKALMPGGILIYETFTAEQAKFGKPRNPEHLLKKGELAGWFNDWEILHFFEGTAGRPRKAVSRIVCRRPESTGKKYSQAIQ